MVSNAEFRRIFHAEQALATDAKRIYGLQLCKYSGNCLGEKMRMMIRPRKDLLKCYETANTPECPMHMIHELPIYLKNKFHEKFGKTFDEELYTERLKEACGVVNGLMHNLQESFNDKCDREHAKKVWHDFTGGMKQLYSRTLEESL